ncbi:MAG: OmpA/MotB family protein [Planctomycetota bacterium]
MSMRRTRGTVVGMMAAATFFAGCDAAKKKEAALIDENSALRDQMTGLRQQLDAAEAARRSLESENAQLRGELSDASARMPAGFATGLEGVTVEGRAGEIVAVIEGDVLFASGSASLRNEAKATLERLAGQIRQEFPGRAIRLVGFTDTDPIRKSNFASNYHLGFQRAYEVGQFLASKGLSGKDMSYTSFGPEMPRATKAKSRRVEVAIVTE